MTSRILVTGGAGFIGSALIRHLLQRSDTRVLNVDKLTYSGNLDSLNAVSDSVHYRFVRLDIADQQAMTHLLETFRPSALINLAAETHVDRSIDGPAAFIHTNLMGTYSLLEAARSYWQALPVSEQERFRFLQVSTDEVYGDLAARGDAFTEQNAFLPSSPYSATKAGADHLVSAWGRTYGLPVLISHCSNNYGPYQFPEKLIPHMILNAVAGQALPVYGDGRQVRDWLHVDDHVQALLCILHNGQPGETYNVGANDERTNLEVVERLCDCLDELVTGERDTYHQLIEFVEDRPGHDRRYAIDSTRVRQLGWQPERAFIEGLEDTVRWYLDNRWWWQRILSGEYRLQRAGLGP